MTADQDADRIMKEAADWCLRNHSASLSEVELSAFKAWLNSSPIHWEEYAAMEKTWAMSSRLAPSTPVLAANQAGAPARQPVRQSHRRLSRAAALVAASALLAFAGWFTGWVPQSVDLYVSKPAPRHGGLPDGSTVEVNIGTTLVYSEFRNSRHVWLFGGEAAFDVAPDSEQPFRVTTDSAQVTVTGTRFNVWSDPRQLIVTLASGRLLIQDEGLPDSVSLGSGEQFVFYPINGNATVSRVDPSSAFAWRDGKLVLDDVALGHALPMINRYLATPLRLGNAELAARHISGIYSITQLEKLPSALAATLGLQLVQQGSELVLYPG